MANRSDRNSVFPRSLKRMISAGVAAGFIPANQEWQVRKSFIEAHAHAKAVEKTRSKLLTNVDRAGDDLEETAPVTT